MRIVPLAAQGVPRGRSPGSHSLPERRMSPPAPSASASIRIQDYDYPLPEECIAQQPAVPRDSSRLMVLDRGSRTRLHRRFRDLPGLLRPRDLLVLNDTRVIPARIEGRKSTGGAVECL